MELERRRFWWCLGTGMVIALTGIWVLSPSEAPMATYVGISVLFSVALAPEQTAVPDWKEWAGYGVIVAPLIAWRLGVPLAIALGAGVAAQALLYVLASRSE